MSARHAASTFDLQTRMRKEETSPTHTKKLVSAEMIAVSGYRVSDRFPVAFRHLESCKTPVMDGTAPTYDELLDLTRRQARQIDELRAEVERLKAELEQSRRAGKRQAAPFSKGPPKADPKRPGRKPGHPPSHRPAPPPEQVDRTDRGPAAAGVPGVPRPARRGPGRRPRPVPDRPARAQAGHHPLPRPGGPLPGLLPPRPGPPPRADLRRPGGRRRPVRPAAARVRRRPEAPHRRLVPQVLLGAA